MTPAQFLDSVLPEKKNVPRERTAHPFYLPDVGYNRAIDEIRTALLTAHKEGKWCLPLDYHTHETNIKGFEVYDDSCFKCRLNKAIHNILLKEDDIRRIVVDSDLYRSANKDDIEAEELVVAICEAQSK